MKVKKHIKTAIGLCLFFSLVGCDIFKPVDTKLAEDIQADFLVETTITNSDTVTHNITATFTESNQPYEASSVKVNGAALEYNGQKFLSTTIVPTKDATLRFVCILNEDLVYQTQTLENNTIPVHVTPNITLAASSTVHALNNTASYQSVTDFGDIDKTQYLGFKTENHSEYTSSFKITFNGASDLQTHTETYNTYEGTIGYISPSLLAGTGLAFTPTQIILEATFSYPGTLDTEFAGGSIQRKVIIKNELSIK